MLLLRGNPGGSLVLEFSTEAYEVDDSGVERAVGRPLTVMPGTYPILGEYQWIGTAEAEGRSGESNISAGLGRAYHLVEVKGVERFVPTKFGERID